jgi:tRNA U34 5-methylaminomethyl-2-thiouridine-forming methyltransferase MnmC
MKRSIVTTEDGSKTIRLEEWNEHYHSTHGAIQEALHVYINAGLNFYYAQNKTETQPIRVLEAGFGTGLNALLALIWSKQHNIQLNYTGVEAYPISRDEQQALDYHEAIDGDEVKSVFDLIHKIPWNERLKVTETFSLEKRQSLFSEVDLQSEADLVFFDAFGPRVQPELWETPVLQRFYDALKPGGVFVTYSVKGTAKRAMQGLGFEVNIIEGPPGKRHMMRAIKSK